ncbi:TetR/AcrR family transcriptional regulator [Cohnella sp. 56]|uniref:TetR/AcrR family transcriptional regulator n=1 Tax=Cohnella sp. 56 TaxID=3113722 RepID=UPI0030E783FD
MTPRSYDAERTKNLIIQEAKNLFGKKGYAATSIEDICEAAGCSRGSVYYHFKSKEDIFVNLAEQSFGDAAAAWSELAGTFASATDKLYGYAEYFVASHNRPLNKAGEEFIAKVGAESEIGMRFFGIVMGAMDSMEAIATEGIASGEFKAENPKELAFTIMSYYSGLSDSRMFMDEDGMKALFRRATTLLLEGLSAGKPN